MSKEPTATDGALYGLRMAVKDLWQLRLDGGNDADQMLNEEGAIFAALASLKSLAEDIRQANDNFNSAAE